MNKYVIFCVSTLFLEGVLFYFLYDTVAFKPSIVALFFLGFFCFSLLLFHSFQSQVYRDDEEYVGLTKYGLFTFVLFVVPLIGSSFLSEPSQTQTQIIVSFLEQSVDQKNYQRNDVLEASRRAEFWRKDILFSEGLFYCLNERKECND